MATQPVPPLPSGPWLNSDRTPTQAFRSLIDAMRKRMGGFTDKVETAATQAAAAVPKTTQVLGTGGLAGGADLGDNAGVSLYVAKVVVADLPTTGITPGQHAFALDGRNSGEGAGSGTGVAVIWSGSAWRINGVASAVTA